jgi:hypothetical protein
MNTEGVHMSMNNTVKVLIAVGALLVVALAGFGIGAGTASHSIVTKAVKVVVPGPVRVVQGPVVVKRVPVPGPAVTKTVQVSAPPPPAGAQITKFSGSGNSVTPEFNVPSDGSYIVSWTFSGNGDSEFGSYQASNFILTTTGADDDSEGLANVIQSSGSGSGEVQEAGSTDSIDVQAEGSWTLTVTAA